MKPERLQELRKLREGMRRPLYTKDGGQDVSIEDILGECIDEVERLKAESGYVVVPEMTEADLDAVWDAPNGCHWNIAAKRGYALAASRVHSVPSSRVLKDGEMSVRSAFVEALIRAAEEFQESRTYGTSRNLTEALDALRAQVGEGGAM